MSNPKKLTQINGLIVNDRFRIGERIGNGSYGVCYEGDDISTDHKVVIKLERKKRDKSSLSHEHYIYSHYLNEKSDGIPTVHWFGTDHQLGDVLVIDLLGPSLEMLFQKCGKCFSKKTVLMIGIQMVELLRSLHDKRVIHRDVKPDNFLLGTGAEERRLFLIDFGLSKRYIHKNDKHIEDRKGVGMVGTLRYSSLNASRGHQQSRRDDLESVAYLMAYFLSGALPWQGLKPIDNDKSKAILAVKESLTSEEVFEGRAPVFGEYLSYCKQLDFKVRPDYELWIQRLRQHFIECGYDWDWVYDWNQCKEDNEMNENLIEF